MRHPASSVFVLALAPLIALSSGPTGASAEPAHVVDARQPATPLDGPGSGGPLGAPCVPTFEDDPTFTGFDEHELTLEGWTDPSGLPVCLALHFRGRVSCPYGQDAEGRPPLGAPACTTPDGHVVSGEVPAQCADRPASRAVVWTCRCANDEGRSDDGDDYCTCPDGLACLPAVARSDATGAGVSGSYCLAREAASDAEACDAACDPLARPCPP